MAKERKEYFYNPIDFNNDVAVGVKLPFGKPNGLFSQSYTTEEQAVSNLKNLLLTRKAPSTIKTSPTNKFKVSLSSRNKKDHKKPKQGIR